jgi:hypothetical protein
VQILGFGAAIALAFVSVFFGFGQVGPGKISDPAKPYENVWQKQEYW